jgi:hypothetical protein
MQCSLKMNDTLFCNLCCFRRNLKKNFNNFIPIPTHINTKKIRVQVYFVIYFASIVKEACTVYKTSYLFYCNTKCQKGTQKINPIPTLGVPPRLNINSFRADPENIVFSAQNLSN